jgi:hypothetical protein
MSLFKPTSFFYKNSLSIVLILLMVIFLTGQYYSGWKQYNEERTKQHKQEIKLSAYYRSAHFIEATFENWESEFLQMALYVLLTISLRQKGSIESKKLDEEEDVDRTPVPGKDSPWPVRKGGIILKIYQNSLSIAFAILFVLSFALHFYGSYIDYMFVEEGNAPLTKWKYLLSSKLWFESFQNWQSEFLAIFCLVVFSIWLRQKGSPQSKPVDAPNSETGD